MYLKYVFRVPITQLLASEKRLKADIEELNSKINEQKKEVEKYKGSLADEEAVKRLKAANETIEQLQKKIAATKQVWQMSRIVVVHVYGVSVKAVVWTRVLSLQEEDALLSEMEFTGQAFEEMQEQNIRVLQELREKEEANLKLMSEVHCAQQNLNTLTLVTGRN